MTCPLLKPQSGTFYTPTPEIFSDFIGQALVPEMNSSLKNRPNSEVERGVYKIATEIAHLKTLFRSSITKSMSARNEAIKDSFFFVSCYRFILVTRIKIRGRKREFRGEKSRKNEGNLS